MATTATPTEIVPGIPVSAVPRVYRYLRTTIQALLDAHEPTPAAIGFFMGEDPTTDLPNDVILIGKVVRTTDPVAIVGGGGTNWLTEKFDIAIATSSWSGDNTGTARIQRAWRLYAYVETAMRMTPGLGALLDVAYPNATDSEGPTFTGPEDPTDETDNTPIGVQVTVQSTVHCERLR